MIVLKKPREKGDNLDECPERVIEREKENFG
jgi:hypothetical protein